MDTTTLELDTDLTTARGALQRFQEATPRKRLVRRLERLHPLHPILMVRRASVASAVLLVVGALVWTSVVAMGVPLPKAIETVIATPSGALAPVLMLGVAMCALAVFACAGEVATILGEQAPMLPDEAKVFQKLQSEVFRTSARQSVRSRLQTP